MSNNWENKIVIERLNYKVDIEALINCFTQEVLLKYQPIWQSAGKGEECSIEESTRAWGGWSLTSRNGSYREGWESGHLMAEKNRQFVNENINDLNLPQEIEIIDTTDHIFPTEICSGIFSTILRDIAEMGFGISRARIACLPAGRSLEWHTDTDDPSKQFLRIHVPILTNKDSFLESQEQKFFLPADGSTFIFNNNHLHRFVNDGSEHRFHLLMDAVDLKGSSGFYLGDRD